MDRHVVHFLKDYLKSNFPALLFVAKVITNKELRLSSLNCTWHAVYELVLADFGLAISSFCLWLNSSIKTLN